MTLPVDPRYFTDPTPSRSQRIGLSVGSILGDVLQRRQQQNAFKALGLSPDLAYLPAQSQQAAIKYSSQLQSAPLLRKIQENIINSFGDGSPIPQSDGQDISHPAVITGLPEEQPTIGQPPTIPQQPMGNQQPTQQPQTSQQPSVAQEINDIKEPINNIQNPRERMQKTSQAIAAYSLIDPKGGKVLANLQAQLYKNFTDMADREYSRVEPLLKEADQSILDTAQKQSALNAVDYAIENGDLSFWSRDNLANVLGIDGLRTATGAAFINGLKEFLIGSFSRLGSRPNQWAEQQVDKSLPQIGRNKQANQIVKYSLQNGIDINNHYVETINKLAEQDKQQYGYIKGDLGYRVNQEMQAYGKIKKREYERKVVDIIYPGDEPIRMKRTVKGKEVYSTVPRDQISEALDRGATPV